MNHYSYGRKNLSGAIHTLAGTGTQAERLVDAIVCNLIPIKPQENLPLPMQQEFVDFMSRMTSVEAAGDEGTVHATVATLNEWDLGLAVDEIIGFYATILSYTEQD